jgi:hypothetical protein
VRSLLALSSLNALAIDDPIDNCMYGCKGSDASPREVVFVHQWCFAVFKGEFIWLKRVLNAKYCTRIFVNIVLAKKAIGAFGSPFGSKEFF